MTECQHCTRKTQLPLCTPCTRHLATLLAELPWLLHQLNITCCRQDHLHAAGTPTTTTTNPINVGAMELLRQTSATLHLIAADIAETHGAERIPALINSSPTQVAGWLKTNLRAIQNHPHAGRHYQAISDLVGDTQPGPIHHAINRPDTLFAGPCPTIRAHNRDGDDIRCNHMLWAHDGEQFTRCPRCQNTIDVDANRRRAALIADLLPADTILDILTTLGEPVRKETLYTWITNGKLRPQGFLTRRGWNKRRTRPSDPRVYSLARTRHLAATTS